jgi:hypothetical protein
MDHRLQEGVRARHSHLSPCGRCRSGMPPLIDCAGELCGPPTHFYGIRLGSNRKVGSIYGRRGNDKGRGRPSRISRDPCRGAGSPVMSDRISARISRVLDPHRGPIR